MVLTTLAADGRAKHRLWAARTLHYPDDGSTELEQPYMELYRPGEPPWRVRSERGWVAEGGEEVHLLGAVEIHREGTADLRKVDAYTRDLRIWPNRDYAETDEAVRYETPGTRVDAIGMRARLDTGQLELLAEVRGRHEPQSRQ